MSEETFQQNDGNDEGFPVADLASILSADDSSEEWVDVPAWKMRVKIRSLSKADQLRARKKSTHKGVVDEAKLEGLLLVYGTVEPKFSEDHIDTLFSKQAVAVDTILTRIMQVSGNTDDTDAEAEATFQG